MRYLVGEVIYEPYSTVRRILTTYMEEYFANLFSDTFQPYKFNCNETVDYCILDDKEQLLFDPEFYDTLKYNLSYYSWFLVP